MFKWLSPKRKTRSEAEEFLAFGLEAHREGDWESAKASAGKALESEPEHAEANYLLGAILLAQGDPANALGHFEAALRVDVAQARFHFSRGEALIALGRDDEAIGAIQRALDAQSDTPAWWHALAGALSRCGRRSEVAPTLERACAIHPGDPTLRWALAETLWREGASKAAKSGFLEAWHRALQQRDQGWGFAGHLISRPDLGDVVQMCALARESGGAPPELDATYGIVLCQRSDLAGGLAVLESTVQAHPECAMAWTHWAIALRIARRLPASVAAFERAEALAPDNIHVLLHSAEMLAEGGGYEAAEARLGRVLELVPESAEGHYRLARLHMERRRFDEADVLFRRAHALAGGHEGALLDLSSMLVNLGRHKEAAEVLFALLALNPKLPQANVNLGVALLAMRHTQLGVDRLLAAREVDPHNVAIHVNLANYHHLDGRPTESEREARAGLDVEPGNTRLKLCLANALQSQGRFEEAVELYRAIVAAEPAWQDPWSSLLLSLNYLPECSPEMLLAEQKRYGQQFTPVPLPSRREFQRNLDVGRRLRVGFVSPDFRRHVVGFFAEPVLRQLDRKRFEVVCYFSHTDADTHTPRFRELADLWREIGGLTDDDAEQILRDDQLDIVVDLAGHTGHNRLALLARRVAPVQVTWLGYPNGTGLEAMDWRLTDASSDPAPEADTHYVERLWRLPDTFLAYEPPNNAPAILPLPCSGNGYITFGTFNNYQKVTDAALMLWKRILDEVPGSRLFAKSLAMGDTRMQAQVRARFERAGFDMARVQLQGPIRDPIAHLAAVSSVDIALDTFPYHGTTTTCETLWMGVPVITLAGNRHASLVGVSLLAALGLQDCIATSAADYVLKAVRLARDPGVLDRFRHEIRDRFRASPLANTARFTSNFEAALIAMWDDWRRDQPSS